jgi:hypothetical protein
MRPGYWPTQRAKMTLGACVAVLLAGYWGWRGGCGATAETARHQLRACGGPVRLS